jgi:hypothetical protein
LLLLLLLLPPLPPLPPLRRRRRGCCRRCRRRRCRGGGSCRRRRRGRAAMLRAVISERPAPEKLVVAAVHATFLRSWRVRSRTRRAPSRSGGGGKTRTILQLKTSNDSMYRAWPALRLNSQKGGLKFDHFPIGHFGSEKCSWQW